jgi:hypothetical protein
MGFFPGAVDGRYDGATGAAVAAFYERSGWAPFGSTDLQLEQLRAARAAAAQARDAFLQSRLASQGAAPGDIAQARIDLETARDQVSIAQHDLAAQAHEVSLAILNAKRDDAAAAADVAAKRAASNKARDALIEAQRTVAEAPPDTSASEMVALQAAVRQAADDVTVAQAELNSSIASSNATREAGRDAATKARAGRVRAQEALPTARRQVVLAERRLQILIHPGETSLQRLVTQAAGQEADDTARDVNRLARKMGIQVPADEVLFFSTLPLRVDSVRVRRGDTVSGRVMTVSNSRLAIDSSLSPNDAKLVRPGARVAIEEPDLGIKATGVVSQVADRPGTHKVDPSRVYVAITPRTAPAQLVGASVKLTIAVKSTQQAVLVVPVTALSVGADGSSRVQVQQSGRSEYVTVEPGLAAQGLVEVRPVRGALAPGDLVVAGKGATGGSNSASSAGATGSSGATGTTGATSQGATPKDSSGSNGKGAGSTSGGSTP